jgi:hypothetical protein
MMDKVVAIGLFRAHFGCGRGLLAGLLAPFVIYACSVTAAMAQAPDPACSALLARVEETAGGSAALSSEVAATNWQANARCLMGYLGQIEANAPIPPATVNRLRVVAGTLRAMIELNAKDFRGVLSSASTYASTRSLALAAASQEQILRLNASFVLANIIDPKITCVIVDQLADPELQRSEQGRNGRANLLGVLRAMANWADPYTRALMREALETSAAQIAHETNVEVTGNLINDVRTRLNTPIRNALQQSENCRGFRPRYARRAFDNAADLSEPVAKNASPDLSGANAAIGSLAELARSGSGPVATTAQEAIWPLTRNTRPDINDNARRALRQAFCYQERNSARDNAGRYLVICHPTAELCERTRGPNTRESVRQTNCTLVQRDTGFEDLQGGGYDGALFRYSPSAFPAPYPPIDQ